MQGEVKGKRLRYIDAMRGLAILLVVFSHVTNAYVKMPITNASFAGVYYMMTMFRMPLFFFVSGYFAFRAAEKWNAATVRRVSLKKFKAQIVGFGVFCFLYGAVMRGWNFEFLRTSNPYWFTESLFEMFFIYLGAALLERRYGWTWIMPALLCVAAATPFVFNYFTNGVSLPEWAVALQAWHTINYFPYFMLGIFARKHSGRIMPVVDHRYFRASMILMFFSLVIFYGFRHRYSPEWDLVQTLMRFSGLMTIFVTFRAYRRWFDGGHEASNLMCAVGSRTLDIYYLHYFFIPDLSFMRGFLSAGEGNSVLMMLLVGLTISSAVVALCMIVSAILRSSPFLADWLFGSRVAGESEGVATAIEGKPGEIEAYSLKEQHDPGCIKHPEAEEGACYADGEGIDEVALRVLADEMRLVVASRYLHQEEAAEEISRNDHHAGDIDGVEINLLRKHGEHKEYLHDQA